MSHDQCVMDEITASDYKTFHTHINKTSIDEENMSANSNGKV